MKAGIGDWTVTCAEVPAIHVKNDGHQCLRPVAVCPLCNRMRAATAAVALADHERECLFRQDAARQEGWNAGATAMRDLVWNDDERDLDVLLRRLIAQGPR